MTIIIGIDPHKASHTAVAIDNTECVLDELRVRACSSQTDRLRSWAAPFPDRVWAIESARGLGYLLAQQLVAAGETVVDVPAVLSTRTRLLGLGKAQKNDPNDARSVAIAALRTDGLARVSIDEHAQVLKLLARRHRDLGRLRGKAACRIHALLMELEPGGIAQRMNVTRANPGGRPTHSTTTRALSCAPNHLSMARPRLTPVSRTSNVHRITITIIITTLTPTHDSEIANL